MNENLYEQRWRILGFALTQAFVMVWLVGLSYAHPTRAQEYLTKRLTVRAENQAIKKILTDIERATGVQFVYSSEVVNPQQKLSLLANNLTLEEVLGKFCKPLGVTYELVGRKIILSANPPAETGFTEPTERTIEAAPKRAVTGQVTDEKGAGMPGVSVLIKGTQRGTTTNAEGSFQLDIPDEAATALVFSFVGYESREVIVGNQSAIRLSLVPESKAIGEVVVTALGIRKQAKAVGYATATVASEQITINRTANFMNALQGKIAGVNITPLGSGPAGTSKIRIRGQSSFGGNNSPLIVVNGVPNDNTN